MLLSVAFELTDEACASVVAGHENDKNPAAAPAEGCDVKVWCKECEKSDYTTSGEKYLCNICGTDLKLDHGMYRGHLVGDYDNLS